MHIVVQEVDRGYIMQQTSEMKWFGRNEKGNNIG